jgi:homoserine dehydrogenase
MIAAVVRDLSKSRNLLDPETVITDDPNVVLANPEIDIVLEAMGGIEPARTYILRALQAGKHVVTANKALLADHGPELFEAARQAERSLCFEAAVGGGIPIIQGLQVGLAANRILSISAILNGTCNFILTAMTRDGKAYEDVLAEAQKRGYAESDPTMDVDGTDTTHKLAVLVQIAFGMNVNTSEIPRQGIDRLDRMDIQYAAELGYTVKLLAKAIHRETGLELRVAPTLVPRNSQLADISDSFNAVQVVGDAVGETLFAGRGAGMMPTASAMVSDLIGIAIEPQSRIRTTATLWQIRDRNNNLIKTEDHQTRFYLRFQIADRPGQLAELTRILGEQGISIASVIQHDPGGSDESVSSVPLIIMTHQANWGALNKALQNLKGMGTLHADPIVLEVDSHTRKN